VYRPYRMPIKEKEILRGIVNELLARESNSPYASPVLLVKKKTNDYQRSIGR
jgi:hypothetical protein